jgi:hypothetical protein
MFDSAYIARRLHIEPSEGRDAIAQWHQALPSVPLAGRSVQPGRRLWLAADPQRMSFDPLRLYAVSGILWMSCRPIPIELDFTVWSDTDCQVAIRPKSLAWPVGASRYARRVTAVLDEVIGAIHAPAVLHTVGFGDTSELLPCRLPVRSAA